MIAAKQILNIAFENVHRTMIREPDIKSLKMDPSARDDVKRLRMQSSWSAFLNFKTF